MAFPLRMMQGTETNRTGPRPQWVLLGLTLISLLCYMTECSFAWNTDGNNATLRHTQDRKYRCYPRFIALNFEVSPSVFEQVCGPLFQKAP